MTAALAIFQLLTGTGLLSRVIQIGGAVLIAAAALAWVHHVVWTSGRDYERALIAKQDAQALARVQAARGTYLACQNTGRVWDTTTGSCN